MPGLKVIDSDGESQEFVEANTWHIDDRGNLHLRSTANAPVASFARDKWQAVASIEPRDGEASA